MGPEAITKLLQDGGVWGLVTVLLATIALLWKFGRDAQKEIAALHEKRVVEVAALAEKTATALEKATGSAATVAAEMATRNLNQNKILDVVSTLPAAIESLSRQGESQSNKIDRMNDFLRSGVK